ncbi:MAG: matrixin family metalloprotease, partial [Planctomycetota bacterium]
MTRGTLLPLLLVLLVASLTIGGVPLRENDGTIVQWDLGTPNQPNVIDGRVTYYLDPGGMLDVPTGLDESISVRRAFQTWEDVQTSRIAFVEDDSRPARSQDSTDRVNLIMWKERYLPPGTLALTFPYSQNGILTDVDIILNDDVDWDTSEVGRDFVADVQAVLTHEIGHMIGLDHVPLGTSTMFPELPLGAIRTRSLEPDDVAAITALYPEPAAVHLGGIRGRVTVDGKGDGRGVLVVAVDPATRLPAASALTISGGLYEMGGLEPGGYRLFCFPLHGSGGMTPYWKETNSKLSGRIWTREGGGAAAGSPARAGLVEVRYSATTFGIDFPDVRLDDNDGEPNDRPADSLRIFLEDSVIGTAASVEDEDWFRFEGRKGDRIAVHVDAWHVGADTNVQVDLYAPGMVDADGVILTDGVEPAHPWCVDIRPHVEDENRTSLEGVDIDAWLTEVVLEEDGYHFVRVTFSPASNVGEPVDYYLLTLYRDHRTPDDRATEVTAHPPSVPAVPGLVSRIRVVPRNLAGEILTDPLTIEVTGEGVGTIGEVENPASG